MHAPFGERKFVMKTSSKGCLADHRLSALFLLALMALVFAPPRAYCQTDKCPGERLIGSIGDKVPAFGGLFVDESHDTLYAYMVPGVAGDSSTLDRTISEVLGSGRPAVHQLLVLPGKYTYQQLSDWNDLLSPQVLALAANVYIYIDDPNNRLKVGLADLTLAPAIQAALATSEIPADAVVIELASSDALGTLRPDEEPAANSIAPLATLRDRFRPVVGGLQIQIDQEDTRSITQCTLGFNATRGKDGGFVTANHCIHDRTSPKTAVFFQPSVAKDNRVGVGEISPPTFDMKKNKKCLEDDKCRYSDTMFVKLDDGAQSSQGIIARPVQGSSDWNGTDAFSIVGKATPMYGLNVTYVGSQSGRISGSVTVASFSQRGGDDIKYLCQTIVKWSTKPVNGDSGSPAFSIGNNNEVNVLGIVWGTQAVSPMVNIEVTDELGPTLQVCVDGKKC
jgi:hypothetical protein